MGNIEATYLINPYLRCMWCGGKGRLMAHDSHTLGSYDEECEHCCGRGIQAIPLCEIDNG